MKNSFYLFFSNKIDVRFLVYFSLQKTFFFSFDIEFRHDAEWSDSSLFITFDFIIKLVKNRSFSMKFKIKYSKNIVKLFVEIINNF
jgi:hypothetical protein